MTNKASIAKQFDPLGTEVYSVTFLPLQRTSLCVECEWIYPLDIGDRKLCISILCKGRKSFLISCVVVTTFILLWFLKLVLVLDSFRMLKQKPKR